MQSLGSWVEIHKSGIGIAVTVLAENIFAHLRGAPTQFDVIRAPRRTRAVISSGARGREASRTTATMSARAESQRRGLTGTADREAVSPGADVPRWRVMRRLTLVQLDPRTPTEIRVAIAALRMGGIAIVLDAFVIPFVLIKGPLHECVWTSGVTCDYRQLALTLPAALAVTGAVLSATRVLTSWSWRSIPVAIIAIAPAVLAAGMSDIAARSHWQLVDTLWVVAWSAFFGTLMGLPSRRREGVEL